MATLIELGPLSGCGGCGVGRLLQRKGRERERGQGNDSMHSLLFPSPVEENGVAQVRTQEPPQVGERGTPKLGTQGSPQIGGKD